MRSLTARVRGRAGAWRWRVGAWRERLVDTVAQASRRGPGAGVSLTFDDGPHPGSTDRVLDTLAALEVRATFFCVGANAERHPNLLRRIAAEGHAVGSHSLTHPDPERTPVRALEADYTRGHAAVQNVLGEPVTLFRPPRGYLDLRRAAQLRRLRLEPRLWSVDPQDWHPDAERSAIVSVVSAAGPGDVVLLHDWIEQPWSPSTLDRTQTIEALPLVVGALRARGLTFTTLA